MWNSLYNQSPVDGQFDYFNFLLWPKGALNVRQVKGELENILQLSGENEADF